ncbi:hypothetical protein [Roseibium sp.]|uniref:hypothetical protein n=1 Tax=Roseibium sp. TaxID=1936156 RepID=UPI003A9713E1
MALIDKLKSPYNGGNRHASVILRVTQGIWQARNCISRHHAFRGYPLAQQNQRGKKSLFRLIPALGKPF